MAGTWQGTKERRIYEQLKTWTDSTGKERTAKRYKVAYRDSQGTVTSQTFSSWKEAVAKRDQTGHQRATGNLPDVSKGRKTVSELWEHLRATSRAKPSTMAWYEARYSKHVGPALGSRRIDSLSRSELQEFLAGIEARTSIPTRRAVQQLIHKLFAVAVQSEWLLRNPADGIEMPGAQEREPRFLSVEELAKVAAEVPPRYAALVWTLGRTGLRIGEAVALKVKNLNGSIRVRENAPEVGGKRTLGSTKTKESERNVPISEHLRGQLRAHLDFFGTPADPESLVFSTEQGRPVSQSNFRRRVFQPAAERAGVSPAPTVHDLRHTAISLMLMGGMQPFEVSKIVGHVDTAMIQRRYGHLYESHVQAQVDKLDALFAPPAASES
jgi:integrase